MRVWPRRRQDRLELRSVPEKVMRFGAWWLQISYVTMTLAGLGWLFSPASSIELALPPVWSGIWSGMLTAFGIVALVSRGLKAWKVESVAAITQGAALWLWAVILLWSTFVVDTLNGLQIGFALLAASAHYIGWGLIEVWWVGQAPVERQRMLEEIQKALAKQIEEELSEDHRRK